MRTLARCGASLLLGIATAQAPIVTTVLSNGTTQTRYDMVILAEGYQAAQQAQFNADVNSVLAALFQKQPYATFAAYYNVHTVFRASVDAGVDHPDEVPAIYRNTVYDGTYNYGGTDRCLYIQNTTQALADAALAPASEGRVLVLVNDSRYGGCASTFAVSYNGASMTEVQIHELGHSLGLLADEYDYPYTTPYAGSEPSAANITMSSTGQKWSAWWGTDSISAFQGAGYYVNGLYRPKQNCLMRSLGVPLCRVCQEGITKQTAASVQTIVASSPAGTTATALVPTPLAFSITHIVPAGNNPLITWKLDGVVVPGANATTWSLNPSTVALGTHTVEATVQDQTVLVRVDPNNVMRDSRSWTVTVTDPTLAQLRFTAATAGPVFAPRGSTVTLDATVTNDGPNAAGPFTVEFFASTTNVWTTNDIYLGSTTVNGLAATGSAPVHSVVTLPQGIAPQLQYVTAVVDRGNAVHESNEADNTRVTYLFVQAGGCGPWLEFRDPLVYPSTAATASRSQGITLHPTFVAPCANPATSLYLIAWTGSGTAPGLPLGPGITLPLNFDGLTQLGLDGLNGPMFGAFLGLLDAQGNGHATFTLPPNLPIPLGTTNFAAAQLGQSPLFTAATNAITLQITP